MCTNFESGPAKAGVPGKPQIAPDRKLKSVQTDRFFFLSRLSICVCFGGGGRRRGEEGGDPPGLLH